MPNEDKIIVSKNTPLQFEARRVIPSPGHFLMDCSNCGSRKFGVHVAPEDGSARVVECVCYECRRVFPIDLETGLFARGGKLQVHERKG